MAKEAPTATVGIDDSVPTLRQIENDITSFEFAIPRATQDVTGVDKTAMERLLLLGDYSFSASGVFNDAANKSHDVGKSVASASVTRTVTIVTSGQTLTNECLLTDYALARGADGSLTWKIPAVLQDGTAPTWT